MTLDLEYLAKTNEHVKKAKENADTWIGQHTGPLFEMILEKILTEDDLAFYYYMHDAQARYLKSLQNGMTVLEGAYRLASKELEMEESEVRSRYELIISKIGEYSRKTSSRI